MCLPSYATCSCRKALYLICLTICYIFWKDAPARSQQTQVTSLLEQHYEAAEKNLSFAETLEELAKQGVNVVTDGVPITLAASLSFKGTIKEALDKIGDAFDFDWTLTKNNIILMTKRFKNSDEFPQVHLVEIRQLTKEILAALKIVSYDPTPAGFGDQLRTLLSSFTSQQLQMLRSGQYLRSRDLTLPQRQLLEQAILNNTFALSYSRWEELDVRLKNLSTSYFQIKRDVQVITRSGYQKKPLLFFYVSKDKAGKPLEMVLQHQKTTPIKTESRKP
jgi:hypothetical protein